MITRFDILGSIPVDGLEEQEKKTSRGTAATERVFGHRKHNSESQKKPFRRICKPLFEHWGLHR